MQTAFSQAAFVASSLKARCCDDPMPVAVISPHLFWNSEKIICKTCLRELRVKQETFLAPVE
jgi:hypothetical protein